MEVDCLLIITPMHCRLIFFSMELHWNIFISMVKPISSPNIANVKVDCQLIITLWPSRLMLFSMVLHLNTLYIYGLILLFLM
jgi:hypothetical protein